MAHPDELDERKLPDEVQDSQPAVGVGELNFDEYTRGGLGRHMGVFSTIFLM